MISNQLENDLEYILEKSNSIWKSFRGERIFISGATGFFGSWLLESLLWANDRLDLKLKVFALTRNPVPFEKKAPHIAFNPSLTLWKGNIKDFSYPGGDFSHIIHAASDTSQALNLNNSLEMMDVNISGTRHILDFAVNRKANTFLLISSGAVYGQQPSDMLNIVENYAGAPDVSSRSSAYAESKRVAEMLCHIYHRDFGLQAKIARCFAFLGPYMRFDGHFAAGNFIQNATHGKTISIKGDGTPYRSYMYATDLTIWLLKILVDGISVSPYNVGSEDPVSIKDLAEMVADRFHPKPAIEIAQKPNPNNPIERYVPSTHKVQTELGLKQYVYLPDAIQKTINWYNQKLEDGCLSLA